LTILGSILSMNNAGEELGFWARLVLAIFVTWRITNLLANEDGPADIIARFRAGLGNGLGGKLMDCFQCLSLWVAAPMAFFVSKNSLNLLLTWLALSGVACLLNRIGQDSIIVQQRQQGQGRDV
jgi:hypothetical protein